MLFCISGVRAVKIDRLFGILAILLEQDRVKAKDLAARFEVSERTIHRDVATIERAGIPIITYPGSGGGIGILDGYTLDKRLLSRRDLAAISAGLAGIGSIGGEDDGFQTLLAKLSAEPASSLALESDILIDLSSWDRDEVLPKKISLLRGAVARRACVEVAYISGSGKKRRTLEPYKIVFKAKGWYLYAYCRLREEFRLFKLERMDSMRETGETYQPREMDGVPLRWEEEPLEGNRQRVVLQVDRSLEHLAVDLFGTRGYRVLEDGRLEGVLEQADNWWVLHFVIGMKGMATVTKPESLRDDIAKEAKKIWEQHQR